MRNLVLSKNIPGVYYEKLRIDLIMDRDNPNTRPLVRATIETRSEEGFGVDVSGAVRSLLDEIENYGVKP